jgi:hypothetical protein
MLKKSFIIFFIFIAFGVNSINVKKENELILKNKGFGEEKMKRLEPVIIQLNKQIEGIVGVNKDDCFVTLNKDREFSLAEIIDEKTVQIKPTVDGFPGYDGDYIKSDSTNNIVWMVRGRGLYFLDLETKKTGRCFASQDGNDKVLNSFLVDPEKKIFLIHISQLTPVKGYFYVLYDLNKNDIIFTSELYHGKPNPFRKDMILFEEFLGGPLSKWWVSDLHLKEKKENKLTKELNKVKMSIWPRSKTLNQKRKLMLGMTGIKINDEYQDSAIKWDDELKEIKVEPLILQKPKNGDLDSGYEFSADENWCKSLKLIYNDGIQMPPELIIFQVADIYPQSLSMPIYCGYTKEANQGAFVNHTIFGPCYVEWDSEVPKKLFVYKLNDGLKILAEEASGAVK